MKVFISWSGTRSRRTAELLRTWLPLINQDFDPFVSGEDISKGGNWSEAIIQELNQSKFGIVCVTPHNLEKPWLLFEAGALSKQVDNVSTKVAPLLIGFKGKRDLPPPLGRFQTTLPSKADMFKLVQSLNATCEPDRQRDPFSLKTVFEKWWDEFEGPFKEIEDSLPRSPPRPRDDSEVIAEVLDIVRELQKSASPRVRGVGGASLTGTGTLHADGYVSSFETPHMVDINRAVQALSFRLTGIDTYHDGGSRYQVTNMPGEDHVLERFEMLESRFLSDKVAFQLIGKVQ